jgi:polyhydroxyalkanoate synthesis repressor PhaR
LENDPSTDSQMVVQLRRYPNRRYYDATRSQHLTLEGIFRLVGEGYEVQVSDSKTGEDITVRVLAQLILEQAPEKLAALPAELLHQIIRANESLLREFVDKYFYRALTAFIESQREFDRYMRLALGLGKAPQNALATLPGRSLALQNLPFMATDWATMMMGPFARAFFAAGGNPPSVEPDPGQAAEHADVRKAVEELKQEVDALRTELRKRN